MKTLFFRASVWTLMSMSSLGFSIVHFELPWVNAESETNAVYQSSQYSGAVWVIETFFLGCPYCNDNAPNVNALQQHFKNDARVQILDVGIDQSDSSYAEWIRRHKPNHAVLKDASRKLVRQLGTTSYPTTYVLDQKLNVVYKSTGVWSSKTTAQIKTAVEKALEPQESTLLVEGTSSNCELAR